MTANLGYLALGALIIIGGNVILGRTQSGRIRLVCVLLVGIGLYTMMLGLNLASLPSQLGHVTSTTPTNSTSRT
jgi:transcription-repair coupling factor (superfamily II helicase)